MTSTSRYVPALIPLRRQLPPRPSAQPSISGPSRANLRPTRPDPVRIRYRHLGSGPVDDLPSDGEGAPSFDLAVSLFNAGDYYRCHDYIEELWYDSEEPVRTLLHGILQCAVGLHHLFSQNHRGAMMELGEGLCKLRKMDFEDGPFQEFEKEVSGVLEFVYQTQKELAACSDDLCLAMDGSETSYQLLGSFAAGQLLYNLDINSNGVPCIIFCHDNYNAADKPLQVKVPTLHATEEHLKACEYK
ncbi:hypothetical protein J5N97_017374 [Dioscorea zingiberensis]|uniref:DUF309 domain-containing protein n=1 Tax=Dioscorea zingiberensis TaxID=325984 RepID=A0A9D5HGA3_9LILI|nr:hypothetical protein J5N97_017374 [Dioscorea zingiberensis]